MPIFRDSKQITDLVSPAGRLVTHLIRDGKVYYRSGGRETVQITLGSFNQTRDRFRAALADRGMDYQTVETIPFNIELVGSGSAQTMFSDCSSLTTVPEIDTSHVTSMNNMFTRCTSLTHAPYMDTSNVTNMSYMFNNCPSLTHVPDMDTSNVMYMSNMFYNCSSLTDGNVRLIGKHTSVTTTNMITNSGLTRLPFYDADGNPI